MGNGALDFTGRLNRLARAPSADGTAAPAPRPFHECAQFARQPRSIQGNSRPTRKFPQFSVENR